ncbi:MAG: DegT/DnrJ/EryC1/StrS family aminotransferase [Gammaproteobacteria bacterium]
MTTNYPLTADSIGEEEIEAAVAVLRSGRYTMSENVRWFERELAVWTGMEEAVMVNSGSSAHLLLVDSLLRRLSPRVRTLKPGDEILVPALSWPTTVWPLVQLGLTPVFVDIDPSTLALSLDSAESALSSSTRGMFLIHVLGLAAPMDRYTGFCEKHGLTLIEDGCESFGAFFAGRHVGGFGRGGTLSHFYSHHLTTMEGGTILTDDSELADDLRSFRAHGWIRDRSDKERLVREHAAFDPRFLFVTTGYNVRPLEVQAAIGRIQLQRMDGLLAARDEVARNVSSFVHKHVPWIKLIGAETLDTKPARRTERRHSWMNLPFLLENGAPKSLEETKAFLEEAGVETRPIIAGNLARHPAAQGIISRAAGELKAADRVLRSGFMIGCNPSLPADGFGHLEHAFQELGRV